MKNLSFLLIIILVYNCKPANKDFKNEQIAIDTTDIQNFSINTSDSFTFSNLPTMPHEMIYTAYPQHRLLGIYKSNKYGNSIYLPNKNYSDNYTYNNEDEYDETEHFMPGVSVKYGFQMYNLAHLNIETNEKKYVFNKPCIIKTIYYPSYLPDSLFKVPIKRNFYLVSAYTEDTNKDKLINTNDLRRIYYFDLDVNTKIQLIPNQYSIKKSQYDHQNDLMYIYAIKDSNKNGSIEITEPISIFSINLKNPNQAILVY